MATVDMDEHSHRQSYQRDTVTRSGSRREGSVDRRQHVASSSWLNSGRWVCWDRVVDNHGLVGDSGPSPAGTDRCMGRCRTGEVEISTCSMSTV